MSRDTHEYGTRFRDFPHVLDFETRSFLPHLQMFGRGAVIPPMVRALEPAPEPESASVTVLRALVADRRRIKQNAESSRKSRLTQADEADKCAADLRERAKDDDATVVQADEEIAAILADIKALGGKAEA